MLRRPCPGAALAATLLLALLGLPALADEAAYRSGSEALRLGRFAEAERALERATRAEPGHAEAWLKLGMARAGLESWDSAIAAYERSLEIDPRNAKAWNNLANVRFRRGDFRAAATDYARALELDPDYLLALFHHGWVLRQLNRPVEAERSFERCIKAPPGGREEENARVDCAFYYGALRFRAGDWATTVGVMEKVVAADPARPEARYYLGMAYLRLGRPQEARAQLAEHAKLLRDKRRDAPIASQDWP